MTTRNRFLLVVAALVLAASAARAQDWAVGAGVGLVNDIERHFRLDDFESQDGQLWVDYLVDEDVVLRGTAGSMKVHGDNAGRGAVLGTSPVVLPDLETRIDYMTIGVSYQFAEGTFTSGLFGGIGGYRIRPEEVAPQLRPFRDRRETVFGWHLGVEGDVRVVSRVSLIGRLEFHNVLSESKRSILTALAGAAYRF